MSAGSSGSTGFAVLRREANEGGFFRPVVKEVVEKNLDCGNPLSPEMKKELVKRIMAWFNSRP